MATLTTANAVITLAVLPLFPIPQQIQGFAADDVFDAPPVKAAETSMGVDGILSGGFVFNEFPWTISLQADSASNNFFDVWYLQNRAVLDAYTATGQIVLPALGMKWDMADGFLMDYPWLPSAKKIVQPRRYGITWGSVTPTPI